MKCGKWKCWSVIVQCGYWFGWGVKIYWESESIVYHIGLCACEPMVVILECELWETCDQPGIL